MERLDAADAWYLQVESPTVLMHVAGVMVLDAAAASPRLTPTRLRHHVVDRFAGIAAFRRRLVEVPFGIDHPCWVEAPDIDLNQQISRHVVGPKGTHPDLGSFVGEFLAGPLDRSRPLWEMAIVEGLGKGRLAVVVKMHHCLVDGMSGLSILGELIDIAADATPSRPSADSPRAERVPGDGRVLLDALWSRASSPLRPVRAAGHLATSLGNLSATAFRRRLGRATATARPLDAPRTILNGTLTERRSTEFAQIPFSKFRAARDALGVTINDIVLATCTGALRDYLAAHDTIPSRPLVCSVPVSTHGQGRDGRSVNQVSNLFVHLPVHLDDPIDQVRAIHAGAEGSKQFQAAVGAGVIADTVELLPTTLLRAGSRLYSRAHLADRLTPIHNLIVSNVPGPTFPLFIAGARVDGLYPVGLITEGTGLNITVFSSDGTMNVGLLACPDLVPNLRELAEGMSRSIERLLAAAS